MSNWFHRLQIAIADVALGSPQWKSLFYSQKLLFFKECNRIKLKNHLLGEMWTVLVAGKP